MSARTALARKQADDSWVRVPNAIVVGKDILELLSSSMYLDPMTIFREYVQNAADAIDAAYTDGLLSEKGGHVAIEIDTQFRNVRIRDNGVGVPSKDFVRRLTAFGASGKRGTKARGFRGVGRLSGLGYCRELVFRSRQSEREPVNELIWDGKKLKSLLSNPDFKGQLGELVEQIATSRMVPNADAPPRFFEVELRGVVRHKNDALLNPIGIRDYLGQVAPVPFHPDFRLGGQIREEVAEHIDLSGLHIVISGEAEPVYRPHRDTFVAADGATETFRDLEVVTVPSVDGGVAAVGWVLHHGYPGAVPDTRIKGLRLRSVNVQVGEHNLLEELFAEPRFNSWSVGEFHVLDRRISPNGRRDHYEQNVHYSNLITHITPLAREISQRCRLSSIERKALRDFGMHEQVAREKLAILAQGTVGAQIRGKLTGEIRAATTAMRRIAGGDALRFLSRPELVVRVDAVMEELDRVESAPADAEPFAFETDPARRAVLSDVVDLIYEVSQNRLAAKALVDRMIERLRDRSDAS